MWIARASYDSQQPGLMLVGRGQAAAVRNRSCGSSEIPLMKRSRGILTLITSLIVLLVPAASFAWNPTGHRVIVSIAYHQLDAHARLRIGEILKHHPAYAELWSNRPTNGADEVRNLLWNASIFPDDARRPPWDKFNHPKEHYIDYRILGDRANKVEPPLPDDNVIDSYNGHLQHFLNPRTPLEDKALDLSWILHQESDIHQPLHAVARFSKAFPKGDRGGNDVHLPNPRGRMEWSNNLHAYWDDLLGWDEDPATIDRLAIELMNEHPAAQFVDELKKTSIRDWAEESVQLCLKTVYNNLDPEITSFAAVPAGYDAAAQKVGRQRIALAGYRLADELKRLLANP